MDSFVLLLRGINVGGRNRLPMADLTALLATLGMADVVTHLQSGNVVCTGPGTAAGVAGRLAAALATELGLTVPVVGRTAAEWAALVDANPLTGCTDDPKLLHVTVLDGVPDGSRVEDLEREASAFAPERLAVSGADVYLFCPGGYADTPLQNAFLERRLGRVATTRNWRTVTALAGLATGR